MKKNCMQVRKVCRSALRDGDADGEVSCQQFSLGGLGGMETKRRDGIPGGC